MASQTAHFRTTPAIEEALERKIAELRKGGLPARVCTRSAICRAIIAEQLGVPRDTSIADEVLNTSYSLSRAIAEQVLNSVMQNTETLVDAAIAGLNAE